MGRSKFAYDLMMKFYKLFQRMERWPLIRRVESEETTAGHIVPVDVDVGGGKHVVLPMEIVRALIERSDPVCIMSECLCRRGEGCRAFPTDLGCLLLGSAAWDLHPGLGWIVEKEEAIAHAKRAIDMGLFPLIVHNEFDAWLWGIDYRRMMNICFCCDCCCSVRRNIRHRYPEGFFENIHRLPGLTVVVGDGCVSCGTCRDLCLADAVEIGDGGSVINMEQCKGCGRCVAACPEGAIEMTFDPGVDTVDYVLALYRDRTDVGLSEDS
jgi:UDP-glucose 4-epimerase